LVIDSWRLPSCEASGDHGHPSVSEDEQNSRERGNIEQATRGESHPEEAKAQIHGRKKTAMSFARRATFAAMITTLTAVCATAKPITTTGETNLRKALGTDSEILTLIPKETTVEVGNCSNGWCQVSWNGQDGYAFARNLAPGLAQEQNAAPSADGQTPPAPPQTGTPGSRDGPPLFDPTARIKYLHDRLRIMPEQEPLWDTVADTASRAG
jgi:hypothetical protein